MKISHVLMTLLMLVGSTFVAGADEVQPLGIVPIKIDQVPILDGKFDESFWNRATVYSGYETIQPDYGKPVSETTTVQVAYDDDNIYFAIQAFDREADKIRANVAKWDGLFEDDVVGVTIDGLNDSQSGLYFIVNGVGSQGDGLVTKDGAADNSIDIIWDAGGQLSSEGYSVELKIPFKSLRYNVGKSVKMGIQFGRQIIRFSETAIFPSVSPDRGSALSQMAIITFIDLKFKRTYEVLPALTQSDVKVLNDGTLAKEPAISGHSLGLTAKLGLTSSLTMDLTYRPDFSQVESDAGQIDANTRFSLFFPEKRPFFLEGAEDFALAASSNFSSIRSSTHTRRIGAPLLGAKVTGRLGDQNGISVLLAIDEAAGIEDGSGENAAVGILRYKRLFGEENFIGAMSSSRGYRGAANHAFALDGYYRINGNMFVQSNVILSQFAESSGGDFQSSHNADIDLWYISRTWHITFGLHQISKNFVLQNGFVPRDGLNKFNWMAYRTWFFDNPIIQFANTGFYGFRQRDLYQDLPEHWAAIWLNAGLARSTSISTEFPRATIAYNGKVYDANQWNTNGQTQIHRMLQINWSTSLAGSPNFDPDDAFQGDLVESSVGLILQPTDQLTIDVNRQNQKFRNRASGELAFDVQIIRSKLNYQINKYLSLRIISESNSGEESIATDLLASFSYFPGSVLFLGYGVNLAETTDSAVAKVFNRYQETRRGIFFKASYNYRF